MSNKPVAAGKSSFDLVDTKQVFSLLALQPESSFLDLACGTGRYSLEATKFIGESGTIYATDLWHEGLSTLEKEAKSQQLKNIKTILVDITDKLPLSDTSIDSCLLATTLHDLTTSDQQLVIKEVARLLKPSARLHVIEFKLLETGPGPAIGVRIGEEDLTNFVTPYGFKRISSATIGEYNYLTTFEKNS